MKLYIVLLIVNSCLISFGQIDNSMLKMRVELNDYKTACLEEGFKGCLYISNISNQKLKLPKHFDLGYYLFDNQNNKLPYRKNAMYEYALKINLDKRLIKPNDTIKVHFFEDRLNYEYDLKKDHTYYIQYFLLHKAFLPNIQSTKIKFKYPGVL